MSDPDPRALALSIFLREQATGFGLSADVNDSPHIADAGMALLAAADLAARLDSREPLLSRCPSVACSSRCPTTGRALSPQTQSSASSAVASWKALATPRRSCEGCWTRYLRDRAGESWPGRRRDPLRPVDTS